MPRTGSSKGQTDTIVNSFKMALNEAGATDGVGGKVNGATIVEDTIQGLINAGMLKEEDRKDIVSTWTYHAAYSYPTPSVERDGIHRLLQVVETSFG